MADEVNLGLSEVDRAEELARREAEVERRESRQAALEELLRRGLPGGLLDAIDLSSAEARERSIESVADAFVKSVQSGVDERLRAASPPGRRVKTLDYASMSDAEYYAATYKNKE